MFTLRSDNMIQGKEYYHVLTCINYYMYMKCYNTVLPAWVHPVIALSRVPWNLLNVQCSMPMCLHKYNFIFIENCAGKGFDTKICIHSKVKLSYKYNFAVELGVLHVQNYK